MIKTIINRIAEKVRSVVYSAKKDDILGKSLRGGGFLAAGSFLENGGRFIRNIILARLLAPEAFGIMATITASVAVIEAITQIGLRQSTIQNKNSPEAGFINAVWWISSIRGLSLYTIAFFAAPHIAIYFNQPEATNILRIGFLVVLLNGLISPRVHLLEKDLRFKKWVILMQGAAICGVIIAIAASFYLRSVWGLVLGYLGESFLRLILSFIFCPMFPSFRISREHAGNVIQFSKRMFGLPILMMIYAQLDIYVIGKILSVQALGMYVLVRSLADMPGTFYSKIVDPILLPVFSKHQDNISEIKRLILLATKLSGIVLIPFSCFMIFFAKPVLRIVYGVDYAALAIPFAIMAVSILIVMMATTIVQGYFALGQPNLHRNASIARTLIFIIIIYPATKFLGLTGAALASLIAMIILISVQILYAKRIFYFSVGEYLKTWLPGIRSALIVIIPGFFLNVFLNIEEIKYFLIGLALCFFAWAIGLLKMLHDTHKRASQFTSYTSDITHN